MSGFARTVDYITHRFLVPYIQRRVQSVLILRMHARRTIHVVFNVNLVRIMFRILLCPVALMTRVVLPEDLSQCTLK